MVPTCAAVFFLLTPYTCDASLPATILAQLRASTAMGKRGSTTAGATTSAAIKRPKTADAETSVIDNWLQSKISDKELDAAEKNGLLSHDPAEALAARPEIIPWLPPGFRVMFIAFILWGLSFPPHPFLRGLLYVYGI
jgi:hypothetical protein